MKKKLALALIVALALTLTVPALAAGKLSVAQENFHLTDSYNIYGYTFAKVTNDGNKPVEFSAGLMEVYDENGDTLTSTDYLNCYPQYLEPGASGYIYAYDDIEDAESIEDIDDYMLTVTGKSTDSYTTLYTVSAEYAPEVQVSKYSTYDYMIATVTNDSDEIVYNMEVVMALLDAEGNVLYVTNKTFYDIGLLPGSTVTYRESISDTWKDAWAREGLTPATVDAIAYVETTVY